MCLLKECQTYNKVISAFIMSTKTVQILVTVLLTVIRHLAKKKNNY